MRTAGCAACWPRPAGARIEIVAPATILATGGVGGLYAVTTNPVAARGEGLALAALAGARIEGAEFVQFHPTAIAIPVDPAPLATEALRGDGAKLVDRTGRAFMRRYHPDGDLAPRDVVARAIAAELRAGRGAFLDAREAVGEALPRALPGGVRRLHGGGDRPARAAPSRWRRPSTTTWAGWRRTWRAAPRCPASTPPGKSLRPACTAPIAWRPIPWSRRRCSAVAPGPPRRPRPIRGHRSSATTPVADLPPDAVSDLRRLMSRDVGVVRDARGLSAAVRAIEAMTARHGPALPLVAAGLIARAALARRESVGGHFRSDERAAARAA